MNEPEQHTPRSTDTQRDAHRNDPAPRAPVRCGNCQAMIFDGLVIKSRVVRVLPEGAEAKCRCKSWTSVPVTYSR